MACTVLVTRLHNALSNQCGAQMLLLCEALAHILSPSLRTIEKNLTSVCSMSSMPLSTKRADSLPMVARGDSNRSLCALLQKRDHCANN